MRVYIGPRLEKNVDCCHTVLPGCCVQGHLPRGIAAVRRNPHAQKRPRPAMETQSRGAVQAGRGVELFQHQILKCARADLVALLRGQAECEQIGVVQTLVVLNVSRGDDKPSKRWGGWWLPEVSSRQPLVEDHNKPYSFIFIHDIMAIDLSGRQHFTLSLYMSQISYSCRLEAYFCSYVRFCGVVAGCVGSAAARHLCQKDVKRLSNMCPAAPCTSLGVSERR